MQRAESTNIKLTITTIVTEIKKGIVMIDIHTHILPCVDDGSSDVEETLEMLKVMAESGVKKVVATPHFYPDTMTVDGFLKNRQCAFEKIKDKIPEGIEVVLGAEVMIDYDMHKEDITKLVIDGTDYLLIEMPYGNWDPWVFDEIFKISAKHGVNIIIAHIDRYVNIARKEDINNIFKLDLKYQVNVDNLGGLFKVSPAVKMLKSEAVHFIGSDCHNMTTRKPDLANFVKKLKSKVGESVVKKCMENAHRMLENKDID